MDKALLIPTRCWSGRGGIWWGLGEGWMSKRKSDIDTQSFSFAKLFRSRRHWLLSVIIMERTALIGVSVAGSMQAVVTVCVLIAPIRKSIDRSLWNVMVCVLISKELEETLQRRSIYQNRASKLFSREDTLILRGIRRNATMFVRPFWAPEQRFQKLRSTEIHSKI